MQEIHIVVMEHIKGNPHHCEYWGEGTYASKNIDCTLMTDVYIDPDYKRDYGMKCIKLSEMKL